ncbi:hypothetical protein PoB_005557500 [Plakobranchus ocellatus]|uniref:Uncharacterized protein n=1 Tax=Plakobranchus ocellatus TaxID=259542 RepID=A0AAV4CCC4_9GAST|nr:hypothetical protein PoB_005557500 [Plakobranchus ocellatus]
MTVTSRGKTAMQTTLSFLCHESSLKLKSYTSRLSRIVIACWLVPEYTDIGRMKTSSLVENVLTKLTMATEISNTSQNCPNLIDMYMMSMKE